MKNQIILLDENNFKVFGFSDELIVLSSKKHSTFDSLLEATTKSGMMESLKSIPVSSLQEIDYNEKDETFTLVYDVNGKSKKEAVKLSDLGLREEIVSEIASIRQFSKSVSHESKTGPLLLNLVAVRFIPLFTWVMRGLAVDAQNGGHYVATGRRSGITQLFTNAAEYIGPMWVTILGVLGFLYAVYLTYKRYKNPASVIKYS